MKLRPGRPAQQDSADARQAIIRAAALQFARDGIKGSSNRQIALAAQVTPAMISYYFPRQDALFTAVLEIGFDDLQEQLPAFDTLPAWVEGFHAHLLAHPWLPHLMIREVLPGNGLLRELFLAQQAPRIFGSLRPLVEAVVTRNKRPVKPDIDRHVILLVGMLVYPFLGLEIGQNLTGRLFDSTMMTGFRDDALDLFLTGLSC